MLLTENINTNLLLTQKSNEDVKISEAFITAV